MYVTLSSDKNFIPDVLTSSSVNSDPTQYGLRDFKDPTNFMATTATNFEIPSTTDLFQDDFILPQKFLSNDLMNSNFALMAPLHLPNGKEVEDFF